MWKILIADDEKVELDGIEFLLRRLKLHASIYRANNGKEALALLEREPFDILISDIKMPHYSGLELCQKIREKDQQMVIILLSAFDDFAFMRRAIQLRVDDYILKPVTIPEFDKAIGRAISILEARGTSDKGDEPLSREERIVKEVRQLIQSHYQENIGLEWLAEQVKLSAGYLSGVFKNTYGQGLTQYLTAVRMEKAKQLVCGTDLRVSEIGELVGYPNTSYFCQQFRKYYGVTVNSMRENGR